MKNHQEFSDEITLVVTAYNRPESLKRILDSLSSAKYPNENVRLVVSTDYCKDKRVSEVATEFKWLHGEKIVINHQENLGLRKHILYCGNLTKKYGNIILLEDDIYVAEGFFNYAKQALNYYHSNSQIAGISLYSQMFNETAKLPFEPLKSKDGIDVFFMQLPSSWGQLWTRSQWEDFISWYDKNNHFDKKNENIPQNVIDWPETSWKKYFIKYMIENDKYFVYPYTSSSTNFGDIGEHFWKKNTTFQVSLERETEKVYKFCSLEESDSVYDAFCENLQLYRYTGEIMASELVVDLYGTKKKYKKFLLSTQHLDYKILKRFDLSLRPMEDNIFKKIKGNNIFLYDTAVVENSEKQSLINNSTKLMDYFYPGINIKKTLSFSTDKHIILESIKGVKKKFKKRFKKKF